MAESRQNEFFSACKNGNIKLIAQLIQEGESVNQCDYGGGTALHFAALKGQVKMVEFLVRNGADVTAYTEMWGHAPIHWAAHDNKLDVLDFLIKYHRNHKISIDLRSNSGDTPLILAAHDGHLPAVKMLVENGANLHIKGMEDRTAVQWAAKKRRADVVEYLVSCGADIETRPKKHKSVQEVGAKIPAIQEAIERGLELLLKKKETGLPLVEIKPVFFWDSEEFDFAKEEKKHSGSVSSPAPPLQHMPSFSVQQAYNYGGPEASYSSDDEAGDKALPPKAAAGVAEDDDGEGPTAHFSSESEHNDSDDDEEEEDAAKPADASAPASNGTESAASSS